MKSIGKALYICFYMILAIIVMLLFLISFFTPEKTKFGTYTDAIKYWTSDEYMCANFDCPVQLKK